MNREHAIDGLRGLAALVVVVSHFLCAFYPATDTLLLKDMRVNGLEATLSQTPFNLLYNGNFAVCVFFVISGYVLSASFFASHQQETIYSSAYRRYFRLMIPVLATSFFYYLFITQDWFVSKYIPPVSDSPWMQKMWNVEPAPWHFIKSTLYDLVVHPEIEPLYNPALWSIGIELKGSYLVYIFLLCMGNHRFRWMGYVGLILLTLKTYYVLFISGIVLSDVFHRKKLYRLSTGQLLILLVIVCYVGSYKYTDTTNLWHALDGLRGIVKPQAIGAVCLFYICLQSGLAARIMTTQAVNFLGKISYSLYLIHLLVIGSLSGIVFKLFVEQLAWSYVMASGATFVITLGVSFILAKVCTQWIDDKGVAFTKRLYGKVFR
ncbi:MAG: acyltransferase [Bacteroidota bacterium]